MPYYSTSTPTEPPKKRKKKAGTPKLSFDMDEEEVDDTDTSKTDSKTVSRDVTPSSTRENTPKRKFANTNISVAPKALTKAALLREAQTRETLRKEFLVIQEQVKETIIEIPFVFYDGTNIPGGTCKVKKGDFVWLFLDRSRKVGAELAVGEKGEGRARREWARVGVDDLMLVRGNIIIPHVSCSSLNSWRKRVLIGIAL
jgi:protein FAM50